MMNPIFVGVSFLCAFFSIGVAVIRSLISSKPYNKISEVIKEETKNPETKLEMIRFVRSVSPIYQPIALFVAIQKLTDYAIEQA